MYLLIRKFKTFYKVFITQGIKGVLSTSLPKISRFLNITFGLELEETDLVFLTLKNNNYSKIMIDVGAHYGNSLKPFADKNWEIFAFEPDKKNRKVLEKNFKDYTNVSINKNAVSDKIMFDTEFYSSQLSSGISGLSNFHESHVNSQKVSTITLKKFCEGREIKGIDFLKIDTEGYDFFVLKGVPWEMVKPVTIICEFENNKSIPLGYSFYDVADFLIEKGYQVIISEWYPIKEYGGPHKWRTFKKYPNKLTDDRSWGNIIASNQKIVFEDFWRRCKRYMIANSLWNK